VGVSDGREERELAGSQEKGGVKVKSEEIPSLDAESESGEVS
jgi:hypothetical protein